MWPAKLLAQASYTVLTLKNTDLGEQLYLSIDNVDLSMAKVVVRIKFGMSNLKS